MRSLKSFLLLAVLAGFLSGCGLSGPLYMPDGSESIKPDVPEDSETQLLKKRSEQDN
jgi:predicted small lipoprotein YifL